MTTSLGYKIRKARELKSISQRKLGMILGLTDKAISSYESDRTIPPMDTLYKIARELDQSIEYFVTTNVKEDSVSAKLGIIEKQLEDIQDEFYKIKRIIRKLVKN